MKPTARHLIAITVLVFASVSPQIHADDPVELDVSPTFPVRMAAWLSESKLKPGEKVTLSIKAELQLGWHIYATTDPEGGPHATEIRFTGLTGLRPQGTFVPDSLPHSSVDPETQAATEYHEQEVTWTIELEATEETRTGKLTGLVHFQVCDDRGCLPPTDVPFELAVKVDGPPPPAPAASQPVPASKTLSVNDQHPAQLAVTVSDTELEVGDTVDVKVQAILEDGWHIYSQNNPKGARPTKIRINPNLDLQQIGPFMADREPIRKREEVFKATSEYFEGGVTWTSRFEVTRRSHSGRFGGTIQFQVCNQSSCLRPETLAFDFELEVAGSTPPAPSVRPNVDSELPPVESAPRQPTSATINEAQAKEKILTGLGIEAFRTETGDVKIEGLQAYLFFGFLAGLILNVMPCVLPVISLKIYGFVQQAGEDKATMRKLGIAFSAGIITVFLILAIVLSATGSGWGSLFQNSYFLVAMVALIVVFGLGMFDVYAIQLPGFLGGLDAKTAQSEGILGSFCKGMLATVLATPCSGPFLGAVLAYALASNTPPLIMFAIFTSIGFGMASPYVLLAWFPEWMKLLPKPGEWMNTFKEGMAFLLFGTVVWLLWQRRGDGEFVVWTLSFCVFVSFGAWLYGRWSTPLTSAVKRWSALPVALLISAFGYWFSLDFMYKLGGDSEVQVVGSLVKDEDGWVTYDIDQFIALRQQGKTVIVDWTADW